jgi:hypothetical protein
MEQLKIDCFSLIISYGLNAKHMQHNNFRHIRLQDVNAIT